MRILVHLAALAALAALGVATGRWLREPNLGGLVLLLLMVVVASLSLRRLYGSRPAPAASPPPRVRGRPRPDLEPPAPTPGPGPALWSGGPADGAPAGPLAPDYRVDINAAGVEDLRRLPGVGPVAAQRIVNERIAGGPFAAVDDLARVPGFGPAKVRSLADRARV